LTGLHTLPIAWAAGGVQAAPWVSSLARAVQQRGGPAPGAGGRYSLMSDPDETPAVRHEWRPMLPDEVREIPKEDLIALCDRTAYRCIEAVNRMSDMHMEELAKKYPKQVLTAGAIAIDKAEVLRKQPDRDIVIRDPEDFQRNIETIARVLAERGALDKILAAGINVQIGGEKGEPIEVNPPRGRGVVDLEPTGEAPPERKPSDFGPWLG